MGLMRCILYRRHKSKPPLSSSTIPSMPTLATEPPTKKLEKVFNKFETNGDGRISSSELVAIFRCLSHPPTDDELEIMMGELISTGMATLALKSSWSSTPRKLMLRLPLRTSGMRSRCSTWTAMARYRSRGLLKLVKLIF